MKKNIVEVTKKIETLVNKYDDIISKEAGSIYRNLNMESAETIENNIQTRKDNNKLLEIGIVGRVKAGKSSLLNALFFDGKNILPKAATPMTAALTVLSYGDVLAVEVEFYTKKDIENIKNNSLRYQEKIEELTTQYIEEMNRQSMGSRAKSFIGLNKKEIKEKSKKRAIQDAEIDSELKAAYEQYLDIEKTEINIEDIENKTILKVETIDNLQDTLKEYVGAGGKYMAFTKSIHIRFPEENLRNIQIVDTPGLNDPVQSREERTRKYLSTCDVVFIVSPSGQFINNEDIELLDRITMTEKTRELYIVSSQIDNQLDGSEKDKHNAVLPKVLEGITQTLGKHLVSALEQLKRNNPEVTSEYDVLIKNNSDRIIHSSAMSQTLITLYDEKEKWDASALHTWERLKKNYPDYFTDSDHVLSKFNLALLSNMDEMHNILNNVRKNKGKILVEKQSDYIDAKKSSQVKFVDEIIEYAHEQIDKIHDTDTKDIKEKKVKLELIQVKASKALEEKYLENVDDLSIDLKNSLKQISRKLFDEFKISLSTQEETTIKSGGVCSSSKTIIKVRTGAAYGILTSLIAEIEAETYDEGEKIVNQWKKQLNPMIVNTLRENVSDDDIDIDTLKSIVKYAVRSITLPEMEYSSDIPDSLQPVGTLKNEDAQDYLSDATNYAINKLRPRVGKDITKYIKTLKNELVEINPAELIFNSYKDDIEQLQEQIANRELFIEKFERLIDEMERVAE